MGVKMAQGGQGADGGDLLISRGRPLYETNPSIVGQFPLKMVGTHQVKGQSAYMDSPDTGEVLASGTFGFIEEKELDSEQFVKVYLEGIKQYAHLTKAGAMLFEFLYKQVSGYSGKDRDTVSLNYILSKRWNPKLARRTYARGLAELLDKEFIFKSLTADIYFVNVRFMFNGDRIAVVKAYRRKDASPIQAELPLAPVPKLSKSSIDDQDLC